MGPGGGGSGPISCYTLPMREWPIILFDGECALCNRSVAFILRRERAPWCRFASLQSPAGRALVAAAGADPARLDTIYLWDGARLLDRSAAALAICRHLRWPWRALGWLRILPSALRDRAYDCVARNRYRWFGRAPQCDWGADRQTDRFLK